MSITGVPRQVLHDNELRSLEPAFRGEHQTSRFVTSKLHNNRPGLVLTGRTDVSLTKAVASIDKLAANVYVQLSLAKRNDTLAYMST